PYGCWECDSFRTRIQVKSKAPCQRRDMEPECLSSTERKDHVNRGLHFYRLVVEQVGSVAPGLHSIHGGLLQHGRSTDDVESFNLSPLGDGGLKHHRAGDAGSLGDRRIDWRGLLN